MAISEVVQSFLKKNIDQNTFSDISKALEDMGYSVPRRTLQYHLKKMLYHNQIISEGKGRWTRYFLPTPAFNQKVIDDDGIVLSDTAKELQASIRRPLAARMPVGYDDSFLEGYIPNKTFYLNEQERAFLEGIGRVVSDHQPAGTYAQQIFSRLLIDLSWNSSRLEGNTYSFLDTKRLLDFGMMAEGKAGRDAQMILNHKDAIEFLVRGIDEIGFNPYTFLNLHGLLANNLLSDPEAPGRLRQIPVGIAQSVFHPLEVPQLIESYFNEILNKVDAIHDPFEQAFFIMVHIPYLQPFDDVNKRVSRLGANISLLRHNLVPLSFTDVPTSVYIESMLGVYEQQNVLLLKEIFMWAYKRSAARYRAVQQSLGEPDPLRLKYRDLLKEIVVLVVRQNLDRKEAFQQVTLFAETHITQMDREHFREMVETELLSLHEGNFARYQIRPSEFAQWSKNWNETT